MYEFIVITNIEFRVTNGILLRNHANLISKSKYKSRNLNNYEYSNIKLRVTNKILLQIMQVVISSQADTHDLHQKLLRDILHGTQIHGGNGEWRWQPARRLHHLKGK